MIGQVSEHKTQAVFKHYTDYLEIKDTIEAIGNAAETLFGDIITKIQNS